MLILRYPAVDMFAPLHQFPGIYVDISDFAMDPLLSALDKIMDDERLLLLAWHDWVKRRPNCLKTGRPSTPVEALLRLQAVRRLYGWAYRPVRYHVKGSLALRQFTRVYGHTVPNHATMNDWERALKPATVRSPAKIVPKTAQNYPRQGGPGPASPPDPATRWAVGWTGLGREPGSVPPPGGADHGSSLSPGRPRSDRAGDRKAGQLV